MLICCPVVQYSGTLQSYLAKHPGDSSKGNGAMSLATGTVHCAGC